MYSNTTYLLAVFVFGCSIIQAKVCDVTDYGARGDSFTNSTSAIQKAIDDCCSEPGNAVYFPPTSGANKAYVTWPILVSGPHCNGLTLEIDGNLSTHANISTWPGETPALLLVDSVNDLTIHGKGGINGNGTSWWNVRRVKPATFAPFLVLVRNGNNVSVSGLVLQDSPKFHLVIKSCKSVALRYIQIYAPVNSPNTDGIDLLSSDNVYISNCHIDNGDDNVAIKPGTSNVLVEDSTCINGFVSNVTVQNVYFSNTQNVARIKTWQGGTGYVRNISYNGIVAHDTRGTVLIDQYYCPHSQHPEPCQNSTKAVKVIDITFHNVTGTHVDLYAGQLLCSDASPCSNVVLSDVHLERTFAPETDAWNCWEVHGTASNVSPPPCSMNFEKADSLNFHTNK
eukprot:gene10028-2202_t